MSSEPNVPLIVGVVIASVVVAALVITVVVLVVIRCKKRKEAEKKKQFEKRLQTYEALSVEASNKNPDSDKNPDAGRDIYDKPWDGIDNFGMITDEIKMSETAKDRHGSESVTHTSNSPTPARKVKLSNKTKDDKGANLYAVVSIYCEESNGDKMGITHTQDDVQLPGNSPDSDSGISDIMSVNKEATSDSNVVMSLKQPNLCGEFVGAGVKEVVPEQIYYELEKEPDDD